MFLGVGFGIGLFMSRFVSSGLGCYIRLLILVFYTAVICCVITLDLLDLGGCGLFVGFLAIFFGICFGWLGALGLGC